ncbi:MAG: membrane-bound O-acyltransferase family protein [Anaerolineaceae bacterium 4572_78]|nr:MAG: membrane-bound O-acyltransferase family protein [Anaerolineaceae bacterium 4572_78]
MLFNSIEFLIFFPIIVILYFSFPYRFRWILLLVASYYFYMVLKVEYVFLIIISTMINYYAGIQMGKYETRSERKKFLILSLAANLGLLFGFKYFNFFNDSIKVTLDTLHIPYNIPSLKVLLLVGISFYTFKTLSYSIDIYRGKQKPEKHFGIFALYVSFFPQLIAGPIERSNRLLPQLNTNYDFDYQCTTDGLKLMLWGFFKKIVIADRLALYVNLVYAQPQNYSGIPLIIATYFFTIQIYCDFSGYSDIAIGIAQVMGYDTMLNFKQPYFSKSVAEFWRRWHISLSTWFRDYLYIPLGGNRVAKWRLYINLMIVFVVSGLWHGANWTFAIWGFLHGFYLVLSLATTKLRQKIMGYIGLSQFPTIEKWVQIFTTFHLVVFGWIFFRAESLSHAITVLQNMFIFQPPNFEGVERPQFIISIFVIIFLLLVEYFQIHKPLRKTISTYPIMARWGIYYLTIMFILAFGEFRSQDFIYAQF